MDSVVRSTTMNCFLFTQEFLRIFYVFVTQVQWLGHRVNRVSGSLDYRVTGSLGHWVTKCDPVPCLVVALTTEYPDCMYPLDIIQKLINSSLVKFCSFPNFSKIQLTTFRLIPVENYRRPQWRRYRRCGRVCMTYMWAASMSGVMSGEYWYFCWACTAASILQLSISSFSADEYFGWSMITRTMSNIRLLIACSNAFTYRTLRD